MLDLIADDWWDFCGQNAYEIRGYSSFMKRYVNYSETYSIKFNLHKEIPLFFVEYHRPSVGFCAFQITTQEHALCLLLSSNKHLVESYLNKERNQPLGMAGI